MAEEAKHQASISQKKSNQHLVATLIYLLDILQPIGLLVSFIFILFARKNAFIRFHALQSFITFLILYILIFYIPFLNGLVRTLLWFLEIALWVLLMVKAYRNNEYKLPYIGNLAEGLLKKIG
ncbi:MAG TPA: hypothetical protein VLF89_03770 [Candidatus Saccharimonadales bacterium]|nr:hypothetical protein [Candidatus Saccharimonadales bacterium]